jgi:stalled ribosome rescue protein Dom34
LWHYLKVKISSYKSHPISIHNLWSIIDEEWNKISQEVCQKLVESMPERIKAVLKSKGGHTRF